jgi:hypothetical protein
VCAANINRHSLLQTCFLEYEYKEFKNWRGYIRGGNTENEKKERWWREKRIMRTKEKDRLSREMAVRDIEEGKRKENIQKGE